MKWTCCKCENQVNQEDMDTEERMCYTCLDIIKEEFKEESLPNVGEVEFFNFMKKSNRYINGYQRFIAMHLVKTWLKGIKIK
tara:strand:- start:47 stop:292 length:246 start_codon:yes stop_codon:yes gene_type:complete